MEEKASKKDSDAMDVSLPNSQNNDHKCSPLVYFFKRTRLYAFPKLFTTDILFLKVFWSLWLILSWLFVIYAIVNQTMHYLDYPKTTAVSKVHVDRAPIPDITICDVSWDVRLQSDDNMEGVLKYTDYYQTLLEHKSQISTSGAANLNTSLHMHWDYLMNYGFMNTIGMDGVKKLVGMANPIQDCKIQHNSIYTGEDQCGSIFETKHHALNTDYPNCYTISLKDGSPDFKTLSLIVHVGDGNKTADDVLLKSDYKHTDQLFMGAKIIFHDSKTAPDVQGNGYIMTPGFAYSADISLSETSRLAAPYGNCGQPDHDMAEHMVGDMEHRYQKEKCTMDCAMKTVLEECECLIREANMSLQTSNAQNKQICGSLQDNNITKSLAQLDCQKNVIIGEMRQKCSCPTPCFEKKYEAKYSRLGWPAREDGKLSLYNRVIKGSSLEDHFSETFEAIKRYIDVGNVQAANTLLQNDRSLHYHFLRVEIDMEGLKTISTWSEEVDFTLAKLFEGFALPFYLLTGFTVFTFAEFIELIIHFICNPKK